MSRRPALPILLATVWLATSVSTVFFGPVKLSASNNGNGGNGNGLSAPSTPTCGANCVNLTTIGSSGTANGALFEQIAPQPTGTGYINPFVRLHSGGVAPTTQGYNTSARPLEFDEKNPLNLTHDLLLADVPVVTINGIQYREFFLDINESNGGTNNFLSLDQIQIYQSAAGRQHSYPSLGTLIWNLDAGTDRWIFLNYTLNHGSGSGDMAMYINNALFQNNLPYVYLFSQFGTHYRVSAGFEEWWTGKATLQVSEPTALTFMGLGLIFAGSLTRRLRSKKRSTPNQ